MKLTLSVNTAKQIQAELPGVQAQLDEIWRLLNILAATNPKLSSPMLAQIQAVKARYAKKPKP
jgi:hypothetical protein